MMIMVMQLRRPRQARSEASLERLLAAAEAILDEKSFAEARLDEIAARAGLTVGAFYARFPGKEALLRALEERMVARMMAIAEGSRDAIASPTASLGVLVNQALRAAAHFYRQNRGLLREITRRARTDSALRGRLERANRRSLGAFVPALLGHRASISHPHPETAILFAIAFSTSTLRDALVFESSPLRGRQWREERLVAELTRAFLAYLGIRAPTQRRSAVH
jgi:AcrR family transcriptional regulator